MAGKFKPFEHQDLELKNQLIDYARSIKDRQEAEAQLACAMIYSSFAEYIAGHMLETFRHIIYQTTYNLFAGIVFIDQREKKKGKPRTMGGTIELLKEYNFPDKDEILNLLATISKSRNNLFHNFAKADSKGLDVLEGDIATIKESTEELFVKVNTIYVGLQKLIIDPNQSDDNVDTTSKDS